MNTTGKFVIEEGTPDDILLADQNYFPNPWTRRQWLELDRNQYVLLSWRNEGELVGYALFQTVKNDDTAHLLKILMLPEKQGTKSTGEFWMSIVGFLKSLGQQSIYLEVEATNDRAISFYNKCGFKLLRRNKAYYSNGEDALMMSLTL